MWIFLFMFAVLCLMIYFLLTYTVYKRINNSVRTPQMAYCLPSLSSYILNPLFCILALERFSSIPTLFSRHNHYRFSLSPFSLCLLHLSKLYPHFFRQVRNFCSPFSTYLITFYFTLNAFPKHSFLSSASRIRVDFIVTLDCAKASVPMFSSVYFPCSHPVSTGQQL